MSQINRIENFNPELIKPGSAPEPKQIDIGKEFKDFVSEVNKAQFESKEKVIAVASGEVADIHEAMLAAEKASLSFQILLEFRNKVLDAYNEVIRMRF